MELRINVTGNAAAGKTTFAAQLGTALDLPVFSLDSVVWKPGWKHTPSDERRAAERELITKPSWIIDGVSRTVRQAADLVLFLDVPRPICAWRGLKRSLRYFTLTRPELPHGCPEWRVLPRLLSIIWRFPAHAGLAIRQESQHDPSGYRILRHPNDVNAMLRALAVAYPCAAAARQPHT